MSEWRRTCDAPFRIGGLPHFPKVQSDEVLVWNGKHVTIASYCDDEWQDHCNGLEPMNPRPDFWMPLPEPPAKK